MQPLKQLTQVLQSLADRDHCVFAPSDLAAAVPECGQLAVLLSRATKTGLLKRVCRGIYFYPVRDYPAGNLLFHAAARLRAGEFNYISLETALSDAGVISQVPMNWITGLTFIGGTCLRACYGSPRLSEDLDFTGGSRFQHDELAALGSVLMEKLQVRYGLPVRVSDPVKTEGRISTR